jgi:uncharacterized protein (TIGR03086 family)
VTRVRRAQLGPLVLDHLEDALVSAAALIDDIPSASFSMPTPCSGWSVLDVVNHLAAVTEKFGRFAAGAAGAERPVRQVHGDLVGTRPARTFRHIAETAMRAWREHPESVDAVCVLPFGDFDGATAAGINLFDAVVHQWDIAMGAGVDHEIDEELATAALVVADLLVTHEARRLGHYGPAMVTGLDAPPSDRLLAMAGRAAPKGSS